MKKYEEEKYKRLLGVETVYIRGNDMIITGCLEDSDDPAHNCDDMGCNSVEDIILRGQFRFLQKGYSESLQEEAQRDG